MTSRKPLGLLRTAGALLALLLPAGLMLRASAQAPATTYNYFPSPNITDGRSLVLAGGPASATLSGTTVTIAFEAPADATELEIGIFDGDTGASGPSNDPVVTTDYRAGHWDWNFSSLTYSLYADPRGDATGRYLVGRWKGNGGDGTVAGGLNARPMPNNDWYNLQADTAEPTAAPNPGDPSRVIRTTAAARNPTNRHFYYVLRVENPLPNVDSVSCFKIRSNATINILAQAISVMSPLYTINDARTIYPAWPATTPSNYDGTWDINLTVPEDTQYLEVWDGDLDFGNHTSLTPQTFDTDDEDTTPALPLWSNQYTQPEGAKGKGSPMDDISVAYQRYSPSINYSVYRTHLLVDTPEGKVLQADPTAKRFANLNPSGNVEWERFLITSDPVDRTQADYSPVASADGVTTVQPTDLNGNGRFRAGNYRVHIDGMDLHNLDAFRFFHDAVGMDEFGDPKLRYPPGPVAGMIGDYVWLDADRGGDQDETLAGIANVKLGVYDSSNTLLDYVYTNVDGLYYYPIGPAGAYSVRVEADNFLPGGPLFGLTNTTGANVLTRTVTNEDVLTYDFGYAPPPPATASIGDRVWLDADGDGVQDGDETGLSGVTVRLLDAGGSILSTQTTDADGLYLFTPLAAGTYTVTVDASTLPAGFGQTFDLDGTATPHTANAGLTDNEHRVDVDFGYKPLPVKLGDRVWLDANANGIQDSGETGVSGVTVNLLDSGSAVVATATTDGSGAYVFDNLAAGSYSVQFVVPAGHALTTANAGSDDAADSDANAAGNTVTTTLAPGQTDLTLDAGIYPLGSIGDTVWKDANGNGVQDSGEPGIPGITVNLLNSSDELVASTVTDGNGFYLFPALGPATYTVVVVSTDLPADANVQTYDLDGTATANTADATLGVGQNRTDVDFGYKAAPASLGDRVWLDTNANGVQDSGEPGVSGVTVRLLNGTSVVATTTTNAGGSYLFENLTPGSYSVQFVAPANHVLSAKDQGGDDTADSDADAAGNTPATTLVAGESDLTIDAGVYPLGSIGDRVWKDTDGDGVQDSGETGISGVSVTLYDAEGDVVATTTTDASGLYSFAGLEAGTYRVTINAATLPATANVQTYDLDGLATPNTAQASLGIGQSRTDVDFGYKAAVVANASIGDKVWVDAGSKPNSKQDSGEAGKSGVTVKLLDASGAVIATTTTNSSGNYSFTNLVPGSYSVQFVAPAGYAFVSKDQGTDDTKDSDADTSTGKTAVTTLSAGENDLTWDAGIRLVPTKPASLGDKVWKDLDNDGIQDKGESGVSGVTVKLLDASGTVVKTTTTDKSGVYSFTNLTPGTYSVQFVAPSSYGFTTKDAGTSDSKDSDADPSTGKTTTITLTSGQNDPNWDAGLICLPARLGDKVWSDLNANGKQDSGEPGVSGVTVKLLTSKGTVLKTTTTDSNGAYSFTNLSTGSYVVQFVLPGSYQFTSKDATSDSADSDADSKTGKTTTISLSAGENDTNWDAGLKFCPASLGDRVWKDSDNDGIQDKGEKGVSGVTVKLLNSAGTVVATTTTDKNGNYKFSNLAPGSYKVKFVAPSGYTFTKKDATSDSSDSDADPTSGETASITLSGGEYDSSVDAGLVAASSAKFTTYTQGGWGTSPSGNNPGTVLMNNFDDVYKNLCIGDKYKLTFYSASAVINYLPAGGTAGVLRRSYTNPTSTEAGVLGGQLTAATLNRDFSAAGITKSGLGNLKVQSGDLAGKTVNQVISLGNSVIGGYTNALPKGCSLSDLVNTLTKINECFDNGTTNTGYLK